MAYIIPILLNAKQQIDFTSSNHIIELHLQFSLEGCLINMLKISS